MAPGLFPGASPGIIYCAGHLVPVRGCCHRYVVNEEGSVGPSVTSEAPRVSEVEGALWVTKGNTSGKAAIPSRASCQVAPAQT